MNCFECGSKCITKYHHRNKDMMDKVIAVNKVCLACGWESYPTKLPEKIN